MQKDRLNELVSIIIPCYNASGFITEAINSVLAQTYTPIEIIIVNDGSTDNLEEAIKSFGDKVIYKYQPNQGVSKARNTGYEFSSGAYICFLDADDWFYPNNIALKVAYLKNNLQVGLVHSIVDISDENLNSTGKYLRGKKGKNLVPSLLNLELPLPCPSNVLIRRVVLEEVGLFDINLSTSADLELWLRICEQFEVGMVEEAGIKYRLHPNSMFTDKKLYVKDRKYIVNKYAAGSKYKWNKFLYKSNFSLMLYSMHKKAPRQVVFYFYHCLINLIKSLSRFE